MRQQEASWISIDKVDQSRARIKRLGYFEDVNVETIPVTGTIDQVDLDFNVTEIPSGSLSAGVGFSQSDGLIFNANITQKNFLGSGKHINFGFNNSSVNTIYSIGYTNPFATVDGISQGFNAFYRETDANEADIANFSTDVWGGDISLGIPVSENNRIRVKFSYENTQLTLSDTDQVESYQDFVDREGEQFDTFSFTLGWSNDSRDSAVLPTSGMVQSLSAQVAIPGGSLQYYKLRYKASWFHPITDSLTFALKGALGYGGGYGDTEELPFFENYYAGGIKSVRGFRANTLGPKDGEQSLGGSLLTTAGAEVIFPFPFLKKELKSVRFSVFADVGNVYADGEGFDAGLLRYSAGVGAIWISPFGGLSISFAQPFNEQDDNETESFQFSLGSTF
jgi:outer membrane protein insertion porin family